MVAPYSSFSLSYRVKLNKTISIWLLIMLNIGGLVYSKKRRLLDVNNEFSLDKSFCIVR
jgi:hypothetical protein